METVNQRDLYIKELQSTGRAGWESVISYLDDHCFFDKAHCCGHDSNPGGTANHCLWTLKFARETRNEIMKKRPGFVVPEDSLVFICLLHDICDCNPQRWGHGSLSRSIMEQEIEGIRFTLDELNAVAAHMHNSLAKGAAASCSTSENVGEVLHYILSNSDHRAIEYAGGIPFGEEPRPVFSNLDLNDDEPVVVHFDSREHRYWWNTGEGFIDWKDTVDLTNMSVCQVKRKAHLYIRNFPLEADFSVLQNEAGHMGLFVVRRFSGMGMPTLMASGKAGFDFTEFHVYVSKYPKYRSSYIVARRTNGKWGIISAKDQFGKNQDYPIGITRQTDYLYDDPDSAINAMKGYKDYPIRIRHTGFFEKIVIR